MTSETLTDVIDWAAVLDERRPWIERVLASRVDDRYVVEELVQDVCVSVLEQPNRPADVAKVKSWLFQITTRRAADYYRRQYAESSRRHAIDREWVEVEADETIESWQWLAAAERSDWVAAAIACLDDDDQFILARKFQDQWTYHQIATHFACSERSAEHRLRAAKTRLRSQLMSYSEHSWDDREGLS